MRDGNRKVIEILEGIVRAASLEQAVARELESSILDAYPSADDDDRFEDLLHMLASYEPGGGDYLYDEQQLQEECKLVLLALRE